MRQTFLVTALVAVLALAGCSRSGMNDIDTMPSNSPQPLDAQPVSPVETSKLDDPTAGPAQFPSAPAVDPALAQQNTELAASNALDVKKETMVGGWKINSGGAGCDMFLTLTNLGSGSRGGTRGCTGEITAMASWEVSGKQVLLKDRDGNVLARVFKTAENRFDGSTSSGQTVSLSR